MPRFAVSMERVRRETRTVIVEADGDRIEPLAAAAVDAFCDRLNVGPRSIPPSETVPIANPEE